MMIFTWSQQQQNPLPPLGFVFLVDPDGIFLVDPDGAYLVEPI